MGEAGRAYELGRNEGWFNARTRGNTGLADTDDPDYWRGAADGADLFAGGYQADGSKMVEVER